MIKVKFSSGYAALLFAALALGACKTSGDLKPGETAEATVEDGEDPSGAKTVTTGAPVNTTSSANAQQLAVLQGELEDARVLARQNEEKLRARITELETENNKLKEELTKAAASAPVAEPPPALKSGGKGAANLWELAIKDLRENRLKEALGSFEEIARSYPKDTHHFHALLGAGFVHYRLRQYKEAAVVFNQTIDKHPKESRLSLAWFGGGCSLAQAGQLEDSKLFFQEVAKRYPNAPEANISKNILSKKRKVPADLLTLFPKWTNR